MANDGSAAFHDHFRDLQDPRVERTRKHPLINILFIAVCGVLSGADSFASIHEFATDRRHWFACYLDLTNGIPSDDTLARVLARLDPAAFEKCLLSWIQAVQEATANRLIAIDGKTLRGSYDRADGRAAILSPEAWAISAFLLLPMIDALLIGLFRLRHRGSHTAETVGFIIAGSVASLAVFTACLIWPDAAIDMLKPICRTLGRASLQGLAQLFGNAALLDNRVMVSTAVVVFEVLPTVAFFCVPPLLAALIGGRIARHLGSSQPNAVAGLREKTRGVEAPDPGMQRAPAAGVSLGRLAGPTNHAA